MRYVPSHCLIPVRGGSRIAMLVSIVLLSGCWIQPKTYVEPAPRSPSTAPAKPPTVPGPIAGSVYTVRSGDTLYAIAFRHGLDYRELARWNQLVDPSRILVGQVLRLSPPRPPTAVASAPSAPPVTTTRPSVVVANGSVASGPTNPSSRPLPPATGASRPTTVSEAIGATPSTTPAPPVSAPPVPAPSVGSSPATTPIADAPLLAAPVPLATTPSTSTGTPEVPAATSSPGPGARPAAPITTPLPVPGPGQSGAPTAAGSAVATAGPGNSAPAQNGSSVPAAAAPTAATPAVAAPATSAPTTINPNAPTKQVSGIRWRWPAEGKLIGRFVAGDPTESGIEIGGRLGQAVTASADGEVVYSGNGLLGYGELIIVQHSPDFLSAYGHNQKRLVNEGAKVKAGQAIAEMGRQGGVDLLHFEIRQSGKPVDPLKFLP
ncbi:peptidoglycan DD-metalloendopeptidase family protein [Ahniella affigens]